MSAEFVPNGTFLDDEEITKQLGFLEATSRDQVESENLVTQLWPLLRSVRKALNENPALYPDLQHFFGLVSTSFETLELRMSGGPQNNAR